MIGLACRLTREDDTLRLGAAIGRLVRPGCVLALNGELGAGKTRFVKGLAAGLGLDPDDVTSPTFTLRHEIPGPTTLCHIDFYRLESAAEAQNAGLDEDFESAAVCAVEWADRLPALLPSDAWRFDFTVTGADSRLVEMRVPDDLKANLLNVLAEFEVKTI